MNITMSENGNSPAIRLNSDDEQFKLTIIGVGDGGLTGTWGIQYSPDGINWFDHEVMNALSGSQAGNVFFPVPYIRATMADRTVGTLTVHFFGSISR